MTPTELALLVAGGSLVGAVFATLAAMMGHLWKRVTDLEALREKDALTKRAQGDHIDVLEAHIWAGKPPPPPARPVGV